MSSALWMLETGKYSVTILDKSEVLPAPDAASTGESCLVYELKKKKQEKTNGLLLDINKVFSASMNQKRKGLTRKV